MAILLYSNGIIEDFKAKNMVFSDKELLKILDDYKDIRTLRLIEIPNSWCVWGHNEDNDDIEYNRIGSGIVAETIFSPLVIIHDGELNPSWNLNEPIILNDYKEFKDEIILFIDNIASQITETDNVRGPLDNQDDNIFLITLGPTKDKKILLEFDQHKQADNFVIPKNLKQFTFKVMEYWKHFFLENIKMNDNTCVIYADVKIIVIVQDRNVSLLMSTFLNYFEENEQYENCVLIKKYTKKWNTYVNKKKKLKYPQLPPASIKNKPKNDKKR